MRQSQTMHLWIVTWGCRER